MFHLAHLATFYFEQAHLLRGIIDRRAAIGFATQTEIRLHYARVEHASALYNLGIYYAQLSRD